MEVVTNGARDGVTPKNSSTTGRFLTAFVFVVAVYAAATTFASSGSSRDVKDGATSNTLKYVTMRDLLQAKSSKSALRRELQDGTLSPTTAPIQPTEGPTAISVVGGNGTVGVNNATRYLQEVATNGTQVQQQVDTNGTQVQQVQTNGTQVQQVQETEANGTRRVHRGADASLQLLSPGSMDLMLPSPCNRVDVNMPKSPEWRARCEMYLNEAYALKDCEGQPEKVPRIYHSVSHHSDQTYHQLATSAQNPSFVRNHLSDDEAADFIKNHCGEDAHQAYRCFAPPAFRADLFRFCALYSQGGIYMDEDIFPFVPLHELYSPCATATVGHDFPWMNKKGKQMKILASAPGAPIFHCALNTIIENVRARNYPESELELTGPQMLQKCYEEHHEDVAITYHDTRNAEWPFTGMRQGQKILAYEIPMSSKHFWLEGGRDKEDYTNLFNKRLVYKETCELQ